MVARVCVCLCVRSFDGADHHPPPSLGQQPRLVQSVFDAFLGGGGGGSGSVWGTQRLPGVDQDGVVYFEADVEKRDAIVKAFQVRCSPLSFQAHTLTHFQSFSMRG